MVLWFPSHPFRTQLPARPDRDRRPCRSWQAGRGHRIRGSCSACRAR